MLKVPVSLILAGLSRSWLVAYTALTLFTRYSVANATGKEVAILDLYPNTSTPSLLSHLSVLTYRSYNASASNIRTKDIFARTQTGAPVDVMCDPETVRVPSLHHDKNMTNDPCHFSFFFLLLGQQRCWFQMLGWSFYTHSCRSLRKKKKEPRVFSLFPDVEKKTENASPWFDPYLISTSIQKDLYRYPSVHVGD